MFDVRGRKVQLFSVLAGNDVTCASFSLVVVQRCEASIAASERKAASIVKGGFSSSCLHDKENHRQNHQKAAARCSTPSTRAMRGQGSRVPLAQRGDGRSPPRTRRSRTPSLPQRPGMVALQNCKNSCGRKVRTQCPTACFSWCCHGQVSRPRTRPEPKPCEESVEVRAPTLPSSSTLTMHRAHCISRQMHLLSPRQCLPWRIGKSCCRVVLLRSPGRGNRP